jgi:hypothetical protein
VKCRQLDEISRSQSSGARGHDEDVAGDAVRAHEISRTSSQHPWVCLHRCVALVT